MPSLLQLHGPAPTTREQWGKALIAVVAPATRAAARGPQWQPVYPTNHDPGATWFELVARPLWGLAAHAAGGLGGANRQGPNQQGAKQQWDELRSALTNAVDPDHPWYIGRHLDMDQRLVESAAVGYALAVAPHELWQPLTARQRENLAAWLQAAAAALPCDNNWCFFPVLAATGLRSVGQSVDEDRVTQHLDRIEDFVREDGWYQDGVNAARDYYIPFGFHFYGLLLASLNAVDDRRAQLYRKRATEFAVQFQHWFAAEGAAVPFGRSLGYRFAQGSFWSMLAAADQPALDWATVRGLAERNLAWWWRQPMADENGGLTVGYAYPNAGVVEQYLAGGSPYWATKLFAALAAPADHPFWTAEAAEPTRQLVISVQPAPAMVLARDEHGDVVALAGQQSPAWKPRGAAAKYAKFAYSTLAGFSVPTGGADLDNGAFDSTLALSGDGEHWRTRSTGESHLEGETLVLQWQPWPDVQIETRLYHEGGGHIREHRIITGRTLHTAEGGFCMPWLSQGEAAEEGISSEITCLGDPPRVVEIGQPMAGSHLLFPRTVLPMLRGTLAPGEHLLRCRVSVTRIRPSSSDQL